MGPTYPTERGTYEGDKCWSTVKDHRTKVDVLRRCGPLSNYFKDLFYMIVPVSGVA